uniref:Uncharacterized protein n=1 Tax=Arundo donax TaxID=35708 RepID=A0A0A8Y517_ARUDO
MIYRICTDWKRLLTKMGCALEIS